MIFKIKKGHHYSNKLLYKLFKLINTKKELSYFVKFDESAMYIDDTEDKLDVHKLFGFSNGLRHNNSYRFGWNYLKGKIQIYGYTYLDGKRIIKEIGSVDINKTYLFTISVNYGILSYQIMDTDSNRQEHMMLITKRKVFGYTLWPYFGGNKTAPNNIFINLK